MDFMKVEMNKFARNFIALLCLILVPLQSAAASPDIVGTYSIMQRGKLVEFIRIESSVSGYTLSEKQSGKWRRPIEVNPVSKAQLEKILKQPVTAPFTGLGSKSIAIFQFPKGWTSRKFTCSTGYWLATVLGPIELHKQ